LGSIKITLAPLDCKGGLFYFPSYLVKEIENPVVLRVRVIKNMEKYLIFRIKTVFSTQKAGKIINFFIFFANYFQKPP